MSKKDYPYNAPPPINVLWDDLRELLTPEQFDTVYTRYIEAQRRYSAVLRLKEHRRVIQNAERYTERGLNPITGPKKLTRARKILANPQAYVDGMLDLEEDQSHEHTD